MKTFFATIIALAFGLSAYCQTAQQPAATDYTKPAVATHAPRSKAGVVRAMPATTDYTVPATAPDRKDRKTKSRPAVVTNANTPATAITR